MSTIRLRYGNLRKILAFLVSNWAVPWWMFDSYVITWKNSVWRIYEIVNVHKLRTCIPKIRRNKRSELLTFLRIVLQINSQTSRNIVRIFLNMLLIRHETIYAGICLFNYLNLQMLYVNEQLNDPSWKKIIQNFFLSSYSSFSTNKL